MAFPESSMALTHILVVADMDQAKKFYSNVLGAEIYREYGGDSCVLQFLDTWLLLVTGGPPTKDKPKVTFAPPEDPNRVSHAMTIRVRDCQSAFEALSSRGAEFLTPPVQRGNETRCFFRDPDGHLLEISEIA